MNKHSEHKKEKKHSTKKQLKIKKITLWQTATVVLAIAFLISVYTGGNEEDSSSTTILSADETGESTVEFIRTVMGQQNAELQNAELGAVIEKNNMYKVDITVQGQSYPLYVSTDGDLLFLQPPLSIDQIINEIDTTTNTANAQATQAQAPAPDIPKQGKPEVELFVMSHCPYGTQAEKGIIPAVELLGDKIDFTIKFVHYAMHGKIEVDEQLSQYCIQKDFNDKYLDYLTCFLGEGKGSDCVAEMGIGQTALDTCIAAADEEFSATANLEDKSTWLNGKYPLFNTAKDLNTKYGVGGSPTLIINGKKVSSSRDSASMLKAICTGFSEEPEECAESLSSASPSPGFGFSTTSASSESTATCG